MSEAWVNDLARQISDAEDRILRAVGGSSGPCPYCGELRSRLSGWWRADDLHEAADTDGAVGMLALDRLIKSGRLEVDKRFRVRRKDTH